MVCRKELMVSSNELVYGLRIFYNYSGLCKEAFSILLGCNRKELDSMLKGKKDIPNEFVTLCSYLYRYESNAYNISNNTIHAFTNLREDRDEMIRYLNENIITFNSSLRNKSMIHCHICDLYSSVRRVLLWLRYSATLRKRVIFPLLITTIYIVVKTYFSDEIMELFNFILNLIK